MWWNQLGVINCELLQPNETSTGERYQREFMLVNRALNLKRPQGHEKVIRCSTPPAVFTRPSGYHFHRSMTRGLAEKHLTSHEEAKNWINPWIASVDEERFRRGIRMLAGTCSKVVANDGQYFE
ncbi:hypothetical protein RB195_008694 [Necator americanus]